MTFASAALIFYFATIFTKKKLILFFYFGSTEIGKSKNNVTLSRLVIIFIYMIQPQISSIFFRVLHTLHCHLYVHNRVHCIHVRELGVPVHGGSGMRNRVCHGNRMGGLQIE